MSRRTAPIKRVELADGRVRYRFVVDVGQKPKIDRATGEPVIGADGRQVMARDQRTFTFDRLTEARTEWARIVAETAKGTYVKPTKLTVDEWLAKWLELKAVKKPTTLRHYIDVLKPVRERFGHLELLRLDEGHLELLKADMLSGRARRRGTSGQPLSPRSVNAMLTALRAALAVALKRQLVVRNVAENVDKADADPDAGADRGEWEAAEAVTFLRSARDDRLYAAFLLSMLGLRRGEVLGVRWDHVDLTGDLARERDLPNGTPSVAVVNNRVVTLDRDGRTLLLEQAPKGRGRRRAPYLPIPRLLVDALKSLRATQAAEKLAAGQAYGSCPQCSGAHLVVNELGMPYRPEWYSDRFVALGKAIGLPRVPLHGSRHCAASLLANLGVPDVAIAAWLGHTEVKVTRGYTHVFAEQLAATSKALGDVLAG